MSLRIKGRKLYVKGVAYEIDVEEFQFGDGEAGGTFGYIESGPRRIVLDVEHQDDFTLAHEAGHAFAEQESVYMSEFQQAVFERFFEVCRDPRNKWFVKYLAGE